jgi:hypothetical protein
MEYIIMESQACGGMGMRPPKEDVAGERRHWHKRGNIYLSTSPRGRGIAFHFHLHHHHIFRAAPSLAAQL